MKRFKKILFFADGSPGEKNALVQAMTQAAHNRAILTVMDVVTEVGTNDTDLQVIKSIKAIQKNIIKSRKDELDKLIAEVKSDQQKVRINSAVIAGKDVEVINFVYEKGFDLIVKSPDKQTALGSIFGHIDMRLMRKCPCPVWIIKPSRRKRIRSILAAVDPTPDTADSLSLNNRIIEVAGALATRENAQLHVIHTWQSPAEMGLRGDFESDDIEEVQRAVRSLSERKLASLLEGYDEFNAEQHLVKGKPEVAIDMFIRKHEVDLVVMGTVARTGIPGFFIGNTAEKVLGSLDCSVLTLKPEGFAAR